MASSPPLARTPSKRKASASPGGSSAHSGERVSRVRFSHVTIREIGLEIWGGGGVPADDGPPLGLSWNLQSTRHVNIDEFEDERERDRTPKDSYCVEGCVEPYVRRQMLLGSGSTHKQIKAATKAVAQLNQDRWKVRLPPVQRAPTLLPRSCPQASPKLPVVDRATPSRRKHTSGRKHTS